MAEAFKEIRKKLGGEGAAKKAASAVLQELEKTGKT
jgi:hypothetical protein